VLSVECFERKFQNTTLCTQVITYSPIMVTLPIKLLSSNQKCICSALLKLASVQTSGAAELVCVGATAIYGRARCVHSVNDTDRAMSYGKFSVECKMYCGDSDILTFSTSSITTHTHTHAHTIKNT
jgi:hypothetical protein